MIEETIYQAFAQQVRATPDAIATKDERRSMTYAKLDAFAGSIASQLPDNSRFVGIVMDHGIEMIASMLAVLKRGAAYVPAEPSFPIDRIRFMLTEADVDAVITQRAYDDLFQSARRIFVENGCEPPSASDATCVARPDDLAYVLYTSGTTGTPKGVSVENRNVVSYIDAFEREFGIGAGDVMLQHSVCSFDIFVEEVFSALLSGATLAIASERAKASTEALIDYIEKEGVTIVDGFPYLVSDINHSGRIPSRVRLYVSGGDVLRASYCDKLLDHALVYNTYGPSETTCCAAYYRVNGGSPLPDGTYPIGTPVACDDIAILDKDLKPVPAGQVGEICISGAGVSRGYLGNHPEQANFVDVNGTRMYRSGDLGYVLPDGDIAFLHRKDSQVMIDGRRIECSEVENVLVADPEIVHAVVCDSRDESDLSYMTAYIVPATQDMRLSELKRRLARKLASFMIPEFFVRMAEIPLNANGKPDKEALPVVLKA
ncbi:amino acid adenylation domain-containing protein [Slackia exigua]